MSESVDRRTFPKQSAAVDAAALAGRLATPEATSTQEASVDTLSLAG